MIFKGTLVIFGIFYKEMLNLKEFGHNKLLRKLHSLLGSISSTVAKASLQRIQRDQFCRIWRSVEEVMEF